MTASPSTYQALIRSHDGGKSILASKLRIADTLVSRTKGLLGCRELPSGEGLWIKRCNSIHTFFMKFSIDAVFVDRQLNVVAVHRDLKPWRITWPHLRATSVFELPSGTLSSDSDIAIGDRLIVDAKGGDVRG